MVTSRFDKGESAKQRDYVMRKIKKKKLMIYSIEIILMVVLFILLGMLFGKYHTSPFYFEIYPWIIIVLIFGVMLAAESFYFKVSIYKNTDYEDKDNYLIKNRNRSFATLVVLLIFLIIFLLALPPLESTVYGPLLTDEMDSDVESMSFTGYKFSGRDMFGATLTKIDAEVTNRLPVDFYIVTEDVYASIDKNNFSAPEDSIAFYDDETLMNYKDNNGEMDASKYVLMVVNKENATANIHIKVKREIIMEIPLIFLIFIIIYIVITSAWISYATSLRKKLKEVPERKPIPAAKPVAKPAPTAIMRGEPKPSPTAPLAHPEDTLIKKLSITCPKCKTRFEIVRTGGVQRIKCPGCGKEGSIGAPEKPKVPETAPTPVPGTTPTPTTPSVETTEEEPPSAAVASAEPVTAEEMPKIEAAPAEPSVEKKELPKKTLACPRCKKRFTVEVTGGPQKIKCPHCGKEGMIGKKKAPPPMPEPEKEEVPSAVPSTPEKKPTPAPKRISCPKCKTIFTVAETKRPLKIKCPKCGKEGVLRK